MGCLAEFLCHPEVCGPKAQPFVLWEREGWIGWLAAFYSLGGQQRRSEALSVSAPAQANPTYF
jgi:hypothetical protein